LPKPDRANSRPVQGDQEYLADLPREHWLEIRMKDEEGNAALEKVAERLKLQRKEFEKRFEEKRVKITGGR